VASAHERPGDAPLDALALVQAVIQGDARACMVTLDNGDPQAIAMTLARVCAHLLESVSPEPLEAIALLRIVAMPG
jgi:hypothetical protein